MPALVSGGKVNHFGIEVIKDITWQGWEPGREYTKNLVLKNVKVKTQKIKYKAPQTRFFNTLFPQPIVLSAGTSFTLPITFRPLEKNGYSDKIEFLTNAGSFEVPIHALLPKYDISIPERVHFSMCATEDYIQLTFDIKNKSELVTPFQVDTEEPFSVEPIDGVLEPHKSFTLTAFFKPKAAAVYEAEPLIRFGANYDQTKSTRFEGIGKFPHLLVTCNGKLAESTYGGLESVLDFKEVPITEAAEKWIELQNLAPVNAPFRVDHSTGQMRFDNVFLCPQRQGVVPANSTIRIPFIYKPTTVNCKSIDYFDVIAIGNISRTTIKCVGTSRGPMLRLGHAFMNFLQVNSKYRATKSIELFNDGDTPASYQFMLDSEESVFGISHPCDTLPPNSHRTLIINFQPVHPIIYYRRVTCIVHNQGAIFLDLLGTCHTETAKPMILLQKHLEQYRVNLHRGFGLTPPELLREMINEGEIKVDDAGFLTKDGASGFPPHLNEMDEYFNDGYYSEVTMLERQASLDTHKADFGLCPATVSTLQKNVNITNHTKGKITVVWTGDASHVFSVSPTTLDIPPHKSAPFTVIFRPEIPNQFYGAELECYTYYKSMRDYRLVEETTQCPPACLTLTTTGNTFQVNNETFLPRFKVDATPLVFPAVNVHEATYRSLKLENTGSTPILFDFEKDSQGVFSVKPTKGLLTESHQLFIVKVLPPAVKSYKHKLKLHMNENAKNTQDILAWGSAEIPDVVLGNHGEMFFKPTCLGNASYRYYSVRNVSRIPLHFEWKMTFADSKLLSVMPEYGIIEPNESQFHRWTFIPHKRDMSIMKPTLVVWGQGQNPTSSTSKERQFVIRVVGEGSLGSIKADQSYVDFGMVIVGSTSSRCFTLINDSDCDLRYRLIVNQFINEYHSPEIAHDDPVAVTLDVTEGVLCSGLRQLVTATVCPYRRVSYQFTVSYQPLTVKDVSAAIDMSPKYLCHLLVSGVFPSVAVTDAHCHGSLKSISKKQLWKLFSMDNLNMCLDADPSSAELMYNRMTRGSHNRRPPVYTRAVLDFNFGAAPHRSEAAVVHLMLENTGSISTDWSFLLPKDLQSELEYWAETGEFDDESLHEMKVMDNKLFTIEPKFGRLKPGMSESIQFTYKHEMAGTDRLPVLFKMDHGRELLLNFIGVTVPDNMQYLHFPSSKHLFSPVPIGEKTGPSQVYELYNGGASILKYVIDRVPLEVLRQENFDHPVFECLSPFGTIRPGQTKSVKWRFSPLEAKTYTVNVPIQVHNGETTLVSFTGVGYDPRAMGSTMPLADTCSLTGAPSVQSVTVPGQLCFLSQECISFSNVPLFSQVRRLIVMTNQSNEDSITYEWHVTSAKDAKVLSISPSRGTITPCEETTCKVIFTATGLPSFYDLDLVCELTNHAEVAAYKHEHKAWETERLRQSIEFTITEYDVAQESATPTPDDRTPSGKLVPLEENRSPTPEGDITRYKTLPPIRQRSVDEQRAWLKQKEKVNEEFWPCPDPPKTFLLHLGVTARSHYISDFQLHFPCEHHHYFIDRLLSDSDPALAEEKKTLQLSCLQVEVDVVAESFLNIIRSLLDDPSFHNALAKIQDELVPYFKQIVLPKPLASPCALTPIITLENTLLTEENALLTAENTQLAVAAGSDSTSVLSGQVDHSERTLSTSQQESLPEMTSVDSARLAVPETRKHHGNKDIIFLQQQSIKKMPEFGSMVESIIDNTLSNIMSEAFNYEFNVTARPRLIALPPRPRTITPADKNNNRTNTENAVSSKAGRKEVSLAT